MRFRYSIMVPRAGVIVQHGPNSFVCVSPIFCTSAHWRCPRTHLFVRYSRRSLGNCPKVWRQTHKAMFCDNRGLEEQFSAPVSRLRTWTYYWDQAQWTSAKARVFCQLAKVDMWSLGGNLIALFGECACLDWCACVTWQLFSRASVCTLSMKVASTSLSLTSLCVHVGLRCLRDLGLSAVDDGGGICNAIMDLCLLRFWPPKCNSVEHAQCDALVHTADLALVRSPLLCPLFVSPGTWAFFRTPPCHSSQVVIECVARSIHTAAVSGNRGCNARDPCTQTAVGLPAGGVCPLTTEKYHYCVYI